MAIETDIITGQGPYIQLARFLLTMLIGVAATKLLLMPISRKLISRNGNIKISNSIENLTGVTGLFLTFTVALQAGDFGGLATIIGAIAAALTVAVGFGMRDQVSSLVGGIFIHLDNPFIKGDYIKTGDFEGVVKEIKLRATVLNGKSSGKLVVPNSQLTTGAVKNYTRAKQTKTSLETALEAQDYDKHEEILVDAAKDQDEVLSTPEPEVVLKGLEDGKVEAELQYWIKNADNKKRVRSRVLEKYLAEADKKGLLDKKEEKE